MNKTKSIVWLCVIVIVLALYAVVSFLPRFEISATDDFVPVVEQIELGADFALSKSPNYRTGEYTIFTVNEYYTDIYGNYVDAEGNIVEESAKVAIPQAELDKKIENTVSSMKQRLAYMTADDSEITVLDGNKIRVEVADIAGSLTYFELLQNTGKVEFLLLPETPAEDEDFSKYESVLSQKQVSFYGYNYDSSTSSYYALFSFVNDGATVFKEESKAYRDDSDGVMYLCMVIDGKLQGTPMQISSTYTNSYVYFTGFKTTSDALVAGIMVASDTYDATVVKKNIDIKAVSSKLGENAAQNVLIAGIVFLVIAAVALIVIFGGMGIGGALGMLFVVLLLVSMFVLVPATLFNLSNAFGAFAAVAFAFAAQCVMFTTVKNEFATTNKARKLAIKDGLKASIAKLAGIHVAVAAVAVPCAVFMPGAVCGFAMSLVFGVIVSAISLLLSALLINILSPLFSKDNVFGLKRTSTKEGK